jgi:hypothetical protein
MRADFVAEVIMARTLNSPIAKNLERAFLEQHGAIPGKLSEDLPTTKFELVPRLLNQYVPKLTFERKPLIAHFNSINNVLIWTPILLTLLSGVMLAGAWLAGADIFVRIGLLILTLVFGALMKWSLSLGLKLAYGLIDRSKPGNLIAFLLGRELTVTTTIDTGKESLLGGKEVDVQTHRLKELIVNKVLWKRPGHSERVEKHVLIVICCLYCLEHAEFSINKDLVIDRLANSIAFLKMNNEDLTTSYLEMLVLLEQEDYEKMKIALDRLLEREKTLELVLYREALNFLDEHPTTVEIKEGQAD